MKNFFAIIIVLTIYTSCSNKEELSGVQKLKPFGDVFSDQTDDASKPETNSCPTKNYGVWNVATCKSSCTRGIGFNCGGYSYQIDCVGRVTITNVRAARCSNINPQRTSNNVTIAPGDTSYNRRGEGYFDFYTNVMKITFTTPIVQFATSPNNTVLEVEKDTDFYIPNTAINGSVYNWVVVKKGVYYIDQSIGQYGATFVNYTLY